MGVLSYIIIYKVFQTTYKQDLARVVIQWIRSRTVSH